MKFPETDGVPEIVTVLPDQIPFTPEGSPEKLAPVALVVAYVILAIVEFIQTDCAFVPELEDNTIVLLGLI